MIPIVTKEVKSLLSFLFICQASFQNKVVGAKNVGDSPEWFKYHICALQEEIGELLKADKRWKTHRNTNYDRKEKLEEMADVFITFMNLAIFSGFNGDEVAEAIINKIIENNQKIEEGKK